MRIQHNIMAMNSYRNFTNNTKAVSKNLEKLSSGYRINNAGDDAAGLAVSEKMRAQVTGLKTASKNAKDGISLVKTAEGALTEVHSMLNRMVDLAGQSANGTYDNEVDRKNLQKEVDALKNEIDRIADSTNFNGIKLLDGTQSGTASKTIEISGKIADTAVVGSPIVAAKSTFTTGTIGQGGTTGGANATVTVVYNDASGKSTTKDITFATGTGDAATVTNLKAAIAADDTLKDLFDVSGGATDIKLDSKVEGSNAPAVTGMLVKTASTDAVTVAAPAPANVKAGVDAGTSYNLSGTLQAGDSLVIDGKTYTYSEATGVDGKDGKTFTDFASLQTAAAKNGVTLTDVSAGSDLSKVTAEPGKGGLTLQIGDTSDNFNKMKVAIDDMHANSLGINGVDISTQEGASAAMDAIKNAINSVSGTRGDLGALQNRLDHTINNLSVMHENIQDAEATIRDTDVADEMMAYTKNNILVQSAQAMLAQANQVPQGVLQLLG